MLILKKDRIQLVEQEKVLSITKLQNLPNEKSLFLLVLSEGEDLVFYRIHHLYDLKVSLHATLRRYLFETSPIAIFARMEFLQAYQPETE